ELLGEVLLAAGDPPGAVAALEEAVSMDRSSASAAFHLGRAYRQDGRRLLALGEFERALELSPDHRAAREARDSVREECLAEKRPPPVERPFATVRCPHCRRVKIGRAPAST